VVGTSGSCFLTVNDLLCCDCLLFASSDHVEDSLIKYYISVM